jgi:serine/threonine-protein kinase RsbW
MIFAEQTPCCPEPTPEDGTVGEWHETRVQSYAEVEPTLIAVVVELAAAGYSEKDQFAVRLALDEALANGVKHGNRQDPAKWVTFRYLVTPETVLAEVEDQGAGFDPDEVPDPLAPENLERASGRGLFLMRIYMTWVRHNERGNRVTLCKQRTLP